MQNPKFKIQNSLDGFRFQQPCAYCFPGDHPESKRAKKKNHDSQTWELKPIYSTLVFSDLSFLRPQFDNPSYSLFILNSWHVSPKIIIQNEWKQSHSGEAWGDTEGHAAPEKRRAGVREERPSAAAHRLREG